ncbi:methyltransferase domain-containing protein [Rhizobium cremeum]|uniref:protein-L-isoaspartate O-methyltransferase family protein n=1 Tax=Rhizobium cremeum TaxID=2813827 RepID=UPI000DDFDF10|nr:methyltransferase domain-containing protein [Rhizobium cremeum]MCJ7994877.1 methyltransferase domain-containing protein [Rhizobium cremeum]MCJ8000127.1 methyltransferase domain-containing protein [Rhizobium cremeum]
MLRGSTEEQRHQFAVRMLEKAGVPPDPALLAAFGAVRREDFVGPPPWLLSSHGGYRRAPSEGVDCLYDDVLVALDALRGVNNGSPSLHALGIHALSPKPGERVCHIGAGTGYYSAILAEMVGADGHVTAVEYDAGLAARAEACLAGRANVEVVRGNGLEWPQDDVDIVYVNFAVDQPAGPWVDRLEPGGRLLFPLGVPIFEERGMRPVYSAMAGYLLVQREKHGYAARFIESVSFVWAEGAQFSDWASHARLRTAFADNWRAVRSLRWKQPEQPDEWYSEDDWGLSTHPPGRIADPEVPGEFPS